jgi:hypothetical protein
LPSSDLSISDGVFCFLLDLKFTFDGHLSPSRSLGGVFNRWLSANSGESGQFATRESPKLAESPIALNSLSYILVIELTTVDRCCAHCCLDAGQRAVKNLWPFSQPYRPEAGGRWINYLGGKWEPRKTSSSGIERRWRDALSRHPCGWIFVGRWNEVGLRLVDGSPGPDRGRPHLPGAASETMALEEDEVGHFLLWGGTESRVARIATIAELPGKSRHVLCAAKNPLDSRAIHVVVSAKRFGLLPLHA